MKVDHHLTSCTKMKDLNIRLEIIKLLEESMGEKFCDIGLGNWFFEYEPRSTGNKSKQTNNTSN